MNERPQQDRFELTNVAWPIKGEQELHGSLGERLHLPPQTGGVDLEEVVYKIGNILLASSQRRNANLNRRETKVEILKKLVRTGLLLEWCAGRRKKSDIDDLFLDSSHLPHHSPVENPQKLSLHRRGEALG